MRRPFDNTQAFSAGVIVIMLAVLGWAVFTTPALLAAGSLAAIVALCVLHGALHWRFGRFVAADGPRLLAYFAAQSMLALVLGLVTGNPVVTLTLTLPVMGEALATLPRRQALPFAGAVIAAAALHAYVVSGVAALPRQLLVAAGTAAFVAFYVEMFERQARARQQAQAALRDLDAAHRQLRAYAEEVQRLTLTNERQRIARELHDTLAQGLAGLLLQLEAMEAHLAKGDSERTLIILRQARERARSALAEARSAIDDLRAAPAGASIPDVIRDESGRFSQATGIPCEVEVDANLGLPPAMAEHVQRCVFEGLANCARHAGATRVKVAAHRRAQDVVVEISDDGVGFDPAAQVGRAGHYGLLGLRERARLAGGTLEVQSARGQGTRLRLVLPAPERPSA